MFTIKIRGGGNGLKAGQGVKKNSEELCKSVVLSDILSNTRRTLFLKQ